MGCSEDQGVVEPAGLSMPGLAIGHPLIETCWAPSKLFLNLWKVVGLWMRMNLLERHMGEEKILENKLSSGGFFFLMLL